MHCNSSHSLAVLRFRSPLSHSARANHRAPALSIAPVRNRINTSPNISHHRTHSRHRNPPISLLLLLSPGHYLFLRRIQLPARAAKWRALPIVHARSHPFARAQCAPFARAPPLRSRECTARVSGHSRPPLFALPSLYTPPVECATTAITCSQAMPAPSPRPPHPLAVAVDNTRPPLCTCSLVPSHNRAFLVACPHPAPNTHSPSPSLSRPTRPFWATYLAGVGRALILH